MPAAGVIVAFAAAPPFVIEKKSLIADVSVFPDANVTGISNIKLELVLSTPHDLRPQHVSWKSVHQGSPDGVTTGSYYKPHSIYSTKAARLASTVGQIKLEQNQLEAAIAELS